MRIWFIEWFCSLFEVQDSLFLHFATAGAEERSDHAHTVATTLITSSSIQLPPSK
jgi:hypothetical protein